MKLNHFMWILHLRFICWTIFFTKFRIRCGKYFGASCFWQDKLVTSAYNLFFYWRNFVSVSVYEVPLKICFLKYFRLSLTSFTPPPLKKKEVDFLTSLQTITEVVCRDNSTRDAILSFCWLYDCSTIRTVRSFQSVDKTFMHKAWDSTR